MLLEKVLAGVSIRLHIWELLCRYETYRKVRSDFSICLIGNFSCGSDFSKNSVDFFKNGCAVLKNLVDFLENLAAILWFGQAGCSPVAPVAFSVALPKGQFAPVSIIKPTS